MLADNLKNTRKAKGLSQEELAVKIGVVRQTISKWEKGLSVPDSEMLIEIAEALGTSVNVLLGEPVIPGENQKDDNELKAISSKLEVLNEQLAKKHERNRKAWRIVFLLIGIVAIVMLLFRLIDIIYYLSVMKDMNSNENVLGWYDGPTSMYVSSVSVQMLGGIANIVVAIVAGIGIYQTRRR